MKRILFTLITISTLLIVSCSDSSSTESKESNKTVVSSISTEAIIAEAEKIGEKAFREKYKSGDEITLNGKINTTATWGDKTDAKFGTGFSYLPIVADFMFVDNGGSKKSTKEKVTIGEQITFKGTIGFVMFSRDGKLSDLKLKNCVTL